MSQDVITDVTEPAAAADAANGGQPPAGGPPPAVQEFIGQVLGIYTGAMLNYMIDIGFRTGLLEALARGPATSAALAERARLHERYVREWLGAMASGHVVDHDPTDGTFTLPPARAAVLTGPGPMNLAPFSQFQTVLAKHVPAVADAFTTGGGVPYERFRPEFTDVMDRAGRGGYDQELIRGWLPLAPGLTERLAAGASAADVACGSGHALVLLAAAFPASTFVGYDIAEDAIERARAEAASAGLTNVRFEVCDVAGLALDQKLDAAFVFDAIHDQADPAAVLRNIHAALRPRGIFVMKEPCLSSDLADNLTRPFAPIVYSLSTLHCLTVSLAAGGAGLGTAWGEQVARRMLADAGFDDLTVHPVPTDPMDAIFVSRRAA